MSFDVVAITESSTAYASSGDYTNWSGAAGPTDIDRLLVRASELIDEYTRTALYDVDDDGLPTDDAAVVAFRDATCAQVEFWVAGDEEDDILGPVEAVGMAGVKAKGRELAPRAARILSNAGLYRNDPIAL